MVVSHWSIFCKVKVCLSFITELELLGYKDIKAKEESELLKLILECSVLPLIDQVKNKYIQLRKSHKIKLADAVVAATAIVTGIPLITADSDFKGISGLNLVTYNHGINLT
jgi:predicted nucleic acid-binding protein